MAQSRSNVLVHLVFSTKQRRAFLRDETVRSELHAQMGGISNSLDCPSLIVGGVEDHVHLLGQMSRTITLAEWIKELKRVSSIWIKEREPKLGRFGWQSGYGAFSVSQSNADKVKQYIRNQVEHHRKIDFQAEFRTLLEKHGVDYDERYIWD